MRFPDSVHFAINHQLLNHPGDPSPDPSSVVLPGGDKARPVICGDEIPRCSLHRSCQNHSQVPSGAALSLFSMSIAICIGQRSTPRFIQVVSPDQAGALATPPQILESLLEIRSQPQDRLAYYDSAAGGNSVDQDLREHKLNLLHHSSEGSVSPNCSMVHFNNIQNVPPSLETQESLHPENLRKVIQHAITFDGRLNVWDLERVWGWVDGRGPRVGFYSIVGAIKF